MLALVVLFTFFICFWRTSMISMFFYYFCSLSSVGFWFAVTIFFVTYMYLCFVLWYLLYVVFVVHKIDCWVTSRLDSMELWLLFPAHWGKHSNVRKINIIINLKSPLNLCVKIGSNSQPFFLPFRPFSFTLYQVDLL